MGTTGETRLPAEAFARLRALAVIVGFVAVLLAAPVARAAEETHVFNARLSLTGDCSTSTADPVADPGCPGGEHPPAGGFTRAPGVAVDAYGNRFVSSVGPGSGSEGRIDVFDSAGRFITEIPDPRAPSGIAVDADGNLYVQENEGFRVVRFTPTVYHPGAGEVAYSPTPTVTPIPFFRSHPVVDPADGHVFVAIGNQQGSQVRAVSEYGSASEGNVLLDTFAEGELSAPNGLALDAAHNRIFVSTYQGVDGEPEYNKIRVRVFELAAPHQLLGTIDGSTVPTTGKLNSETPPSALAVDEASGHVFVGELASPKRKVYEFEPDGTLVSVIEHSFAGISEAQLAYDNGPESPTQGYLFVPSSEGASHSFAF